MENLMDFEKFVQKGDEYGVDTLKDIIDIFLVDYPGLVESLDSDIREGNLEKLKTDAHAFKNYVLHFESQAVFDQVYGIEQKAKAGDPAGLDQMISGLKGQLEKLHRELLEAKARL